MRLRSRGSPPTAAMSLLDAASGQASLTRRSESGVKSEAASLLDFPDAEDGYELDERHKAKRESLAAPRAQEPTLRLTIQPGDTLQTLSLKYNVPLAEIKRVNQIFQDNEFFALKSLKLPLRSAHSALIELAEPAGLHRPQNGWLVDHHAPASPSGLLSGDLSSPLLSDESELECFTTRVDLGASPSRGSGSRQARQAKRFLKAKDQDLAQFKERHESWRQSSQPDLDSDETDEGAEADDQLLLQPPGWLARRRPFFVPQGVCWVYLGLIVVAVLVILYFARHEFLAIKEEPLSAQMLERLHEADSNSPPDPPV